jgi:hypothetical protein
MKKNIKKLLNEYAREEKEKKKDFIDTQIPDYNTTNTFRKISTR